MKITKISGFGIDNKKYLCYDYKIRSLPSFLGTQVFRADKPHNDAILSKKGQRAMRY
jgi:hypothetical protein